MARAFIGIGSNKAPEENIREALRRLAHSVTLVAISTFYREPALEGPDHPDFYNGVAAIATELPAMELKWEVLRRIEADLGRVRSTNKYAPRTIDLDLLLYGDLVISSSTLTLPDPDVLKRPFVAVPLYEIAPALVLPGSGIPIHKVARSLSAEGMRPLGAYTQQLRNELL